MSRKDAQELERGVENTPNDLVARLQLLGFHFRHQFCCPQYKVRRVAHIVWLIERHPNFSECVHSYFSIVPQDKESFETVKLAWEGALANHAGDADVLGNMAMFLQAAYPKEAEQLMETAIKICPESEKWTELLGDHRSRMDQLLSSIKRHELSPISTSVGSVKCPLSSA